MLFRNFWCIDTKQHQQAPTQLQVTSFYKLQHGCFTVNFYETFQNRCTDKHLRLSASEYRIINHVCKLKNFSSWFWCILILRTDIRFIIGISFISVLSDTNGAYLHMRHNRQFAKSMYRLVCTRCSL